MKAGNRVCVLIYAVTMSVFAAITVDSGIAQERSGEPGAPNATTTIDGKYLPNPPAPFEGKIGLSAAESKPFWRPKIVPPKDAPNILLIMTDDAGYGVPSTFGGVIPTPVLDRIAKTGLRYTRFHSTALCSPSRAALLTGRNHHAVGAGVVLEQTTGFPGYDGVIGIDNGTIGEILKQNGYATSWFGKNHNTPSYQYSLAGPFDQWPVGLGFEYFYGFMGGETDQHKPFLFRNTTQISPWLENPEFNLVTGMANDAIEHLRHLNTAAPDKPFFCYYVPGATHAPHQPTKEWIDRIREMHLFDQGWNKLRETIFANQKRLGVIPADTQLTPWQDELQKWDDLTEDEKKLFIRQAEVFAAYVAYADHEIGRVIQAIEDMGKLDDTLIIYIEGDNGTSSEGSLLGTPFDWAALQQVLMPVAEQLKYYDEWGSAATEPHMAAGWAWAFSTPFKWVKQIASHFGGTRQGMAISWPKRIKDQGGIRPQFHHLIDIVPTILEATGIPAPQMLNGIAQKPIEGVSMVYTWDKANANAPSRRQTQYFEIFGNRGIYHDGWFACTTPPVAPWFMGTKPMPDVVNGYQWELYNIERDFSQNDNLAAKQPEKLKALQELFLVEATKNQVLPLDNSVMERVLAPKPSYLAGRDLLVYTGEISGLPDCAAPNVLAKSFTITADVDVPADANGMIVTQGGNFGGYGFYLLKSKPVFTYNLLSMARFRWEGATALTPGKHTLVFDFKYDGPGLGKGGTGVLKVDGTEVASKQIPQTIPVVISLTETFDVGVDTRTGVDEKDYQVPFRFNGKLEKVTFKLGSSQVQGPGLRQSAEPSNNTRE